MDDPYRIALEQRIRELIRYDRWLEQYGADPRYWADIRHDYKVELRALLRIRNSVRRAQHVDARGDHFVGIGR